MAPKASTNPEPEAQPPEPVKPQTLNEWANSCEPQVWPRDLARMTGIHIATAYRLMDGHCWPTFKTAEAIYVASGGRVALWNITEYMKPDGADED